MTATRWSSLGRRATVLPKSVAVSLCLWVLLTWVHPANAAVVPSPAQIHVSGSGDFPDMVLVAHRPGDPATAKIIPADAGVSFGPDDSKIIVLAVPRALADKRKGEVDPAWLQPSAPGVVLVGKLTPHFVYRPALVRYQAVKDATGPSLKLLNPDELRAARAQPRDDTARSPTSESAAGWSPFVIWGGVGAAGLALLGVVLYLWRGNGGRLPPGAGGKS